MEVWRPIGVNVRRLGLAVRMCNFLKFQRMVDHSYDHANGTVLVLMMLRSVIDRRLADFRNLVHLDQG